MQVSIAHPKNATDLADAAALAVARADAELAVAQAVAANHRAHIPVAEAAGITAAAFAQDDLRNIYGAFKICRDKSLGDALSIAKAALRRLGHWDHLQIPGNVGVSSRWSWPSLIRLVISGGVVTAADVELAAEHLLDLIDRQREIDRLAERIRLLVAGRAQPSQSRTGRAA